MNGEKLIDLLWEVKEGRKHPNKAFREIMKVEETETECACPPEHCDRKKVKCKNIAYR